MDPSAQRNYAEVLKQLHIPGEPLLLLNVWDAGSAQAVQSSGAKVIATSSLAVAAAHGYEDGEKLPFEWVLSNLERIIASVERPVTLDLEGGYGQSPEEVYETVDKVIKAGVAGINFEDQKIGSSSLYSIEAQCKRIRAARHAADEAFIPIFINARTDIFLQTDSSRHEERLEESIERENAYLKAGADGFFVPGLNHPACIEKLCVYSLLPVNVMMSAGMLSPKALAELGVARISYGPAPYYQMIDTLKEMARQTLVMI